MKINWGTGIVMAFVGFIAFILFFVVKMTTDRKADHELVTDDYYKQELAYQKVIDSQKAAIEMGAELIFEKTGEGLRISFPEDFEPSAITGKVSLYRPSNRHLDDDFTLRLSDSHLLIPDNRLVGGRWDITVSWSYGGKSFFHKEKITY